MERRVQRQRIRRCVGHLGEAVRRANAQRAETGRAVPGMRPYLSQKLHRAAFAVRARHRDDRGGLVGMKALRGLGIGQTRGVRRQQRQTQRVHAWRADNGRRAIGRRLRNIVPPIGDRARQRGEDVSGFHLPGVGRQPRDGRDALEAEIVEFQSGHGVGSQAACCCGSRDPGNIGPMREMMAPAVGAAFQPAVA